MSYYTKITTAGLAAITTAMNNSSKIPITYMAFGDGNGYIPEPDENATSLVNEVYRVGVNKVEVHSKNPNWLVCEAIIPSAVGGFNIREVALYDSTGNTMLAIASYPPTYKPTVEEGAAKIQTIRIVIQVDNSGNFELIVDPDIVLATTSYVDNKEYDSSKIKHNDGSLDLLLEKLPNYSSSANFPVNFEPNHYFYGKGRRSLSLNLEATKSGFIFNPTSTARNALRGVHLFSNGQTKTSGTFGVNTSDSSFAVIDDVRITGFDTGIIDNNTPNTFSFSARNSYRECEVNNCNIGVKAYGANANSYSFSRVFSCDVGFDFNDAESINLYGLNIENCKTGIKTHKSEFINAFGGYLEAGTGNKNFDLDTDTSIGFYGLKVNGARGYDECWNPNISEWHFDAKDTAANRSRISFIADASYQYIRNSDFSQSLIGYTLSATSAPTCTWDTSDFESAAKSLVVTPTATTSFIEKSFNIERDVRRISFACRFKPTGDGRFQINFLSGSTVVGQYTYTGGASEEWLTATITAKITDTSLPLKVRIYPSTFGDMSAVKVDQMWAVRGYFVSAPRRYIGGIELLSTPKILVSKTDVTSSQTDIITLTDIPTLAKGYRVRFKLTAAQASSKTTRLYIDNTSASLYALKDATEFIGEYTIVGTTAADVRLEQESPTNMVNYSVEIIEWLL